VPDAVSVVGFDDIALAGLARVSLTTVAQPREALAELGSSIMLARIASGTLDPLRQVRLDPRLVVRSSTAPVAA
jgi:DNA-binding LacI/PurR family transcriptional regulator